MWYIKMGRVISIIVFNHLMDKWSNYIYFDLFNLHPRTMTNYSVSLNYTLYNINFVSWENEIIKPIMKVTENGVLGAKSNESRAMLIKQSRPPCMEEVMGRLFRIRKWCPVRFWSNNCEGHTLSGYVQKGTFISWPALISTKQDLKVFNLAIGFN